MDLVSDKIGKQIANSALENSIGRCLQYVRKGIQRALEQPDQDTGIQSAKDAQPWMLSKGFKKIDTLNFTNGDTVIMSATPAQGHGHIQTYYNGKWYSDFRQDNANPWVGSQVTGIYRFQGTSNS